MFTQGLRFARGLQVFSIAAVVFALGAGGAWAEEGDDCPTLFPDFRCEREGRFENFVQPMGFPYLFEDPFITTGANLVGIWHGFAENRGLQEGYAGVLALQLRLAITDRLAFIATKDGLFMFRPDTQNRDAFVTLPNPDRKTLRDDEGFMNMTVGFKYAAWVDEENDFIFTPAFRYEIPLGNDDVFQGRGDGILIPSATFAWGATDQLRFIGGMGGQIPVSTSKESTSFFYNAHAQYHVAKYFVPFVEMNGIHWTDGGNGQLKLNTKRSLGANVNLNTAQAVFGTGSFEGADVANLGSKGIAGENLVVLGFGFRVPLNKHLVFGVSYDRAVKGDEHLFDERVTAMATYEY